MKILNKVSIRNEQKVEKFSSDLTACHGFSLENRGNSIVRFSLASDTGEVTLFPSETIEFSSVGEVAFEDDRIEGDFSQMKKM